MNPKKMGALVIDALEDIKAKNIVMINVSKITSMFDYIVVATGDSNRQTNALINNVRDKLKEAGAHVYGSEGEETGEWVLLDLGDIVVHVMLAATREYYRLEELWRDGKIEFPKPEKETETGLPASVKVKARVKAKAEAKVKAGTKVKMDKGADTKKPAAKNPATRKPTTRKPSSTSKVSSKAEGKITAKTTVKTAARSAVKATPATTAKATGKVAAKAGNAAKSTPKATTKSTSKNTTVPSTATRRRTTKAKSTDK